MTRSAQRWTPGFHPRRRSARGRIATARPPPGAL